MKNITPYSEERRELKSRAIIALDKPLLKDLRETEDEPILFCETFHDLLMATSSEDETEIIIATPLKEVFDRIEEEKKAQNQP